jgi:hypothetical protein
MHLVRIIACLSVLVATTQVASAGAILELSDGITTVSVLDGGAGDINAATGAITYYGSIGNFSMNVTTGLSKPVIGGVNNPKLDLNSINVSSSGGGTLTIRLTDDGFGSSGYPGWETLIGGVTGGTISLVSSYTLDGGTEQEISNLGPFSAGAFSASVHQFTGILTGSYSLSLAATIVHSSAANSSFNAEIQPNPEPSTLALLGAAAVGFAALRRRRRAG